MIRFFNESVVRAKERNCPYWKLLYKVNKLILNLIYPIIQKKKCDTGISEDGPAGLCGGGQKRCGNFLKKHLQNTRTGYIV